MSPPKAFKKQQEKPIHKSIQKDLMKKKVKAYNANSLKDLIDWEAEIDSTLYFSENLSNIAAKYPSINFNDPYERVKAEIEKYEEKRKEYQKRQEEVNDNGEHREQEIRLE